MVVCLTLWMGTQAGIAKGRRIVGGQVRARRQRSQGLRAAHVHRHRRAAGVPESLHLCVCYPEQRGFLKSADHM